jgi:hypothetical protein
MTRVDSTADETGYDHLFDNPIILHLMRSIYPMFLLFPLLDLMKSDESESDPRKKKMKKSRSIFNLERMTDINESSKGGLSAADLTSLIYNFFQSCYLVYMLVNAFKYTLNSNVSGSWDRYQVFYGILSNTAFILIFSRLQREEMMNTPIQNDFQERLKSSHWLLWTIFVLDKLALRVIQIIVVFPPLLTHAIPGSFVYSWVAVLFFACLFGSMLLTIYALVYVWMLICYCTGMNPHYRKHIPRIMGVCYQLVSRLSMVFSYQTVFNYMYLFYAANGSSGGTISGSDYLGVISDEYHYRSQTYCLVNNYRDNAINFVTVFNWL